MVLKNDLFIQVNDLLANRDPVSGGTIKTSNISNSNPLVVSRTNNINIHQSQFENINKQLELLQASVQNMPNNILDGMGVFTYNVNVIAVAIGSILLNGRILKYNANVSLPLINDELIYTTIIINTSTVGIKYLIASNNQGAASINVVTNPNITDVIIAKIVINNINGDIDDDANEDRSNNYIVSGKDLLFNSQYVIDDDTKFELQNVLTDLLAENLTGVLRANSDLSITNQDNSVLIDSNGMKIYNDEVKYAEFNRDGIYFTNEDGNLLSQYTKDGAVIGNISITPSSLQSTNFQSGNNGFKIGSDGNVEFNNITARGTIYARAGLIGGVSLTHNKTYVGTGSFNNANTAYYLDSDGKFSLKDKFSWDGTTLSITGSITAVSGIIGGWTITSGALYTGDMYLNGSNGSITTTNFSVNSAGTMSASSAIISGNITANTLTANSGGTIAGWSMTATTLSGGNMTLNSDGSITTTNFGVNTSGILSATSAIISGNITADTLTTTNGTIGGWTIGTTSLSATNMALNSDGSITTTNFNVTSSGLLTATNAVISGNITASTLTASTAGNIAGWEIQPTLLRSASSGNRIELNKTLNRISIFAASGTEKVVMGYLSGLTRNDASGVWGSNDYGFWALDGDNLVIDGDVEYVAGDWLVQNDASLKIYNGDATPKEIIRLGTHTPDKGLFIYNTSGTQLAKYTSDEIYIGETGKSLRYTTASGLVITGKVSATSGFIGGWTIGADEIYAGNMHLNDNGSITTANFGVTSAGILSATGAIISGNITITGGSVPWTTVNGGTKPADNADVTSANTAADTTAVNGVSAVTVTTQASAGNIANSWIGVAPASGVTILSGGYINTNIIDANTITAGQMNVTNLAAINANMGSITAGSLTLNTSGYIQTTGKTSYLDTDAGFWLGYDTSAYKLNIGNATNYIKWDGSSLNIAGSITIISGTVPWANITGEPTTLSGISPSEGSKLISIASGATLGATWGSNIGSQPTTLSGISTVEGGKLDDIEVGADVTSTHTSADTTNVNGVAAATVTTQAARGSSAWGWVGTAPVAGQTILAGGYINTNVIDVDTITATQINVTKLSAISADMGAITAGSLTLDTSGYLNTAGKTSYTSTASGIWMGYDSTDYKLNVGNASKYVKWTGTELDIKGNISADNILENNYVIDSSYASDINQFFEDTFGAGASYALPDSAVFYLEDADYDLTANLTLVPATILTDGSYNIKFVGINKNMSKIKLNDYQLKVDWVNYFSLADMSIDVGAGNVYLESTDSLRIERCDVISGDVLSSVSFDEQSIFYFQSIGSSTISECNFSLAKYRVGLGYLSSSDKTIIRNCTITATSPNGPSGACHGMLYLGGQYNSIDITGNIIQRSSDATGINMTNFIHCVSTGTTYYSFANIQNNVAVLLTIVKFIYNSGTSDQFNVYNVCNNNLYSSGGNITYFMDTHCILYSTIDSNIVSCNNFIVDSGTTDHGIRDSLISNNKVVTGTIFLSAVSVTDAKISENLAEADPASSVTITANSGDVYFTDNIGIDLSGV